MTGLKVKCPGKKFPFKGVGGLPRKQSDACCIAKYWHIEMILVGHSDGNPSNACDACAYGWIPFSASGTNSVPAYSATIDVPKFTPGPGGACPSVSLSIPVTAHDTGGGWEEVYSSGDDHAWFYCRILRRENIGAYTFTEIHAPYPAPRLIAVGGPAKCMPPNPPNMSDRTVPGSLDLWHLAYGTVCGAGVAGGTLNCP